MTTLDYDELRTTGQQRNLVRLMMRGLNPTDAAKVLGLSKQRGHAIVRQLIDKGLLLKNDEAQVFVSVKLTAQLLTRQKVDS